MIPNTKRKQYAQIKKVVVVGMTQLEWKNKNVFSIIISARNGNLALPLSTTARVVQFQSQTGICARADGCFIFIIILIP